MAAGAAPAPSDRAADDRRLLDGFRRNARTFHLAARLLPRPTRLAVATLYRYCRTVDEIADGRPAAPDARERLERLRAGLAATLDGHPPDDDYNDVLWNRLGEAHEAYGLDGRAMEQLIDGAAWDVDGRPIPDTDALLEYSELVAGSVGAMMLPILLSDAGMRAELEAPARALGRAMQITNILRDVGEDRDRLRRSYLPADALARHAVDLERLTPPVPAGYAALCEELMALAEDLYGQASAGIERLPRPARPAVRAAGRMYREILNEVRRADYDNLTRRAVVPLRRKLAAAAGGYEARRARLLAS